MKSSADLRPSTGCYRWKDDAWNRETTVRLYAPVSIGVCSNWWASKPKAGNVGSFLPRSHHMPPSPVLNLSRCGYHLLPHPSVCKFTPSPADPSGWLEVPVGLAPVTNATSRIRLSSPIFLPLLNV